MTMFRCVDRFACGVPEKLLAHDVELACGERTAALNRRLQLSRGTIRTVLAPEGLYPSQRGRLPDAL